MFTVRRDELWVACIKALSQTANNGEEALEECWGDDITSEEVQEFVDALEKKGLVQFDENGGVVELEAPFTDWFATQQVETAKGDA